MLVSHEGKRETVNVGRMSIFEKNEVLEKNEVHILICGAISNLACADLINKEIEVIPWIRGPVEEVLLAHSLNKLGEAPFLMPGCRTTCRTHAKENAGMKKGRYR
jgi:predicted Fe-Mo cluster-binding NifX family protein